MIITCFVYEIRGAAAAQPIERFPNSRCPPDIRAMVAACKAQDAAKYAANRTPGESAPAP